MTVLFDTNVLIDAAVATRDYHGAAVRLMAAAERNEIEGLYAPISTATCWYITHEKEGVDPRSLFRFLADVMESAPMESQVLLQALQNPGTEDFEDAYLAAAGVAGGASAVVTRNEADFARTELTPYHPLDLVRILTS